MSGQGSARRSLRRLAVPSSKRGGRPVAGTSSSPQDPIDPDRVNVYEEWDSDTQLEAFRGAGPGPELIRVIERADVSRHRVASSGPA